MKIGDFVDHVSSNAVPPKFTGGLVKTLVSEGSAARFDCKVEGNPTPEVVW